MPMPAGNQHMLACDFIEGEQIDGVRDFQTAAHPHLVVHENAIRLSTLPCGARPIS